VVNDPEHLSGKKSIFYAWPSEARRADTYLLLAARIKKTRPNQTKFKVRCKRYLYTLVLKDAEKADKLKQSLPPGDTYSTHSSLLYMRLTCFEQGSKSRRRQRKTPRASESQSREHRRVELEGRRSGYNNFCSWSIYLVTTSYSNLLVATISQSNNVGKWQSFISCQSDAIRLYFGYHSVLGPSKSYWDMPPKPSSCRVHTVRALSSLFILQNSGFSGPCAISCPVTSLAETRTNQWFLLSNFM
jgi:hypothetical protein